MPKLYKVNEKITRGIKLDLLAFIYKKIGTREGKKGYLIKVSDTTDGEQILNIWCYNKSAWDNGIGKAVVDQWYIIKNLNKNDEGFVYYNKDSSIKPIPDITKFDIEGYRSYQSESENKSNDSPPPPEPEKPETKTKSHNDPIIDAYQIILDGFDKIRSGFEILMKERERS